MAREGFTKLPHIRVRAGTLILLLFLAAADRSAAWLIPTAAAICHEAGHLVIMLLLGVRVSKIDITLFGAEIRSLPVSDKRIGPLGQGAIYFGGAAANIITGAAAALLGFDLFAVCSLTLAALNLLPVRTLDGGCILELLLGRFLYANLIINMISAIFIFILWLASVYIILLCRGNLSLLMFAVYMFFTLFVQDC